MKGAVSFGYSPQMVTSRVARYNYCVDSFRDPLQSDHPSRIKPFAVVGNQVQYLHCFVKKHQLIKVDEEIIRIWCPLHENVETVRLNLYTTETETDDPNHPSATHIQEIQVSSPDVSKGKNRNILVSLRFGGTDILFKAIDEESGNVAQSTITF